VSNDGANFQSDAAVPILRDPVVTSVVATLSDVSLVIGQDGKVRAAVAKPDSSFSGFTKGWVGKDFTSLLDGDSTERFRARCADLASRAENGDPSPFRWVELVHKGIGSNGVPVRYAMHWVSQSEEVLLLGQDQRPVMEMQQQLMNAQIALEQDYESQRELDTRYRLLMDFTSDAVALVSATTGNIVDLNHNAASLFGTSRADLLDTPFAERFSGRRRGELMSALSSPLAVDTPGPIEVELKVSQQHLLLSSKLFRAAGEQLIFVRMSDPEMGSVADGKLVANLRQLFYRGPDAMVFTDRDGNILSANETFLNLTDVSNPSAVQGRSVADFLARGVVDLKVLLENAQRAGQLRMYSTKLKTDFDATVAVEISATWLDDRLSPVMALVIRNASSAAARRGDGGAQDADMRGVMELVGSSTLKDIVAETTNVIEKICIETAIELTRNNRVAAAEMLGLSRQSLYVKLRKYDMLSRDED
jgi:transcriptional regulator PpsR